MKFIINSYSRRRRKLFSSPTLRNVLITKGKKYIYENKDIFGGLRGQSSLVDTFSFSNRPSKWSNLSRNFVKLSPQEHCKNEISCLKVKGRRKIVKGRNWKSQQRDQIGDHIGEAQSPKCCLFKIWKIMMRPIDQISKLNNNNVIRNTMHCSGNFCQLSHFLRMEPLPLWCQPVWRL